MSTTEPIGEQGLVRVIGVRGLTSSIVNTTVGAGISSCLRSSRAIWLGRPS